MNEKNPAVGEMQKETDEFSAVAVRRENRADQIRNVHPGRADALAAGQNGRIPVSHVPEMNQQFFTNNRAKFSWIRA
jgi:hypothetical protein